jgi:hypothetical protein
MSGNQERVHGMIMLDFKDMEPGGQQRSTLSDHEERPDGGFGVDNASY